MNSVDETAVPLLHDAQSYLKSLLERKAPETALVDAWEEFYRVYDGLIRRFVISQGVPRWDVDDCVQEVWSAVVVGLIDFERPPHRPGLRSWLYTLVRRKAADAFRDKVRRSAVNRERATITRTEQNEADPAALCELRWETALLASVLAELRQQLPEVNYRILHMRLIEDRAVKEVASELNLAPEQVRNRHKRAMRRLRTYLTAFTGER